MKKDLDTLTDAEFNELFDFSEKERKFRNTCTARKRTKTDPKLWEKLNEKNIKKTFRLDDETVQVIEEIYNKNI